MGSCARGSSSLERDIQEETRRDDEARRADVTASCYYYKTAGCASEPVQLRKLSRIAQPTLLPQSHSGLLLTVWSRSVLPNQPPLLLALFSQVKQPLHEPYRATGTCSHTVRACSNGFTSDHIVFLDPVCSTRRRVLLSRDGGGRRRDVHVHEPVRRDGVAGGAGELGQPAAGDHGVRAGLWGVPVHGGAGGVVRPVLGAHGVRLRRHRLPRRLRQVRHGRLRQRRGGVPRRRRDAPRHARRVHPRRRRDQGGLLRREPGGRVQRARGGGGGGVPCDGVRRRPQRALPAGAQGVGGGAGVPERVRGVRAARVLLQRRLRQPGHVPPVHVLAGVQGGLPARIQLRLRRRLLHLHLLRLRRLLRHLLPPRRRHPQQPQVEQRPDAEAGRRRRQRAGGGGHVAGEPGDRRLRRRDDDCRGGVVGAPSRASSSGHEHAPVTLASKAS